MIRCNSVHVQYSHVYTPEGSPRITEVNLLEVAKENMIGVAYEILSLAVIKFEQTMAKDFIVIWRHE